jgi:putative photosynthetic complex assembly protein
MSAVDAQPFPKGLLIAAAALIAVSIAVAGAGRWVRLADQAPAPAPSSPAHAIDLTFADQANGGVLVQAAGGGGTVAVIPPNSGGFVRGVLRGLTRERRLHGIGSGPAFRLSQWANGHVEIEDLADGRRIDLDAFGPTNRDAFLHLLPGAQPA